MAITTINVKELYDTVHDLARKHRSGGYVSDEQFNRHLKATEIALLKFFYQQYEERQEIVEHLTPFIVRADLTTAENGSWNLPDDFAYRLSLEGVYIDPIDKDDENQDRARCYPCHYLQTSRVAVIKTSYIAQPSLEAKRFYHHYANKKIYFEPRSTYYFNPIYLRYPVFGSISYNMSTVNGEDVLTVDVAQEMEWRQITFDYFKYLMLQHIGVIIKDNPTIQYGALDKSTGVLEPKNQRP